MRTCPFNSKLSVYSSIKNVGRSQIVATLGWGWLWDGVLRGLLCHWKGCIFHLGGSDTHMCISKKSLSFILKIYAFYCM